MVIAARRGAGAELFARKRRLRWTKCAIACLFVLVLLFLGNQGRQRAAERAALEQICEIRDQLEERIVAAEDLAQPQQGHPEDGGGDQSVRGLNNAETRSLADKLRTELAQFESKNSPAGLSLADNLELRLCQATVANAERRFGDALSIINEQDLRQGLAVAGYRSRQEGVLIVRADASFGLGDWKAAQEGYHQLLTLRPDRVTARKRLGECQYKLGELDEARATFEEVVKVCNERGDSLLELGRPDLAARQYRTALVLERKVGSSGGWQRMAELLALTHNQLGNALLVLGKPETAGAEYEKALSAQTTLTEQQKEDDLTAALALAHYNSGNALLAAEGPDRAAVEYQKAIEILTSAQNGGKMNGSLALAYKSAGDAHFAQGNADAAAEDYAKAIGLFEIEKRPDLTPELGMSYNNRGVARRATGNAAGALSDFQKAVTLLTGGGKSSQGKAALDGGFALAGLPKAQVQLDVTFKHSSHGTEVLTRTRVSGQPGQNEAAIALATSLENRGYAQRLQGNLDGAAEDFHQAAEVYAKLVEEEGERSLTGEFAKSLATLAWFYATSPNAAFQDAARAKPYARQACVLSDWKAADPLEALAAACAGCAEFDEAAKWQQKAIDQAPGQRKAELLTRLQLYRAGRPYHDPK